MEPPCGTCPQVVQGPHDTVELLPRGALRCLRPIRTPWCHYQKAFDPIALAMLACICGHENVTLLCSEFGTGRSDESVPQGTEKGRDVSSWYAHPRIEPQSEDVTVVSHYRLHR